MNVHDCDTINMILLLSVNPIDVRSLICTCTSTRDYILDNLSILRVRYNLTSTCYDLSKIIDEYIENHASTNDKLIEFSKRGCEYKFITTFDNSNKSNIQDHYIILKYCIIKFNTIILLSIVNRYLIDYKSDEKLLYEIFSLSNTYNKLDTLRSISITSKSISSYMDNMIINRYYDAIHNILVYNINLVRYINTHVNDLYQDRNKNAILTIFTPLDGQLRDFMLSSFISTLMSDYWSHVTLNAFLRKHNTC